MTLDHYLKSHGISYTAFARLIGTPHARTVERYVKRARVPSGLMMAAIVQATKGAVQPVDFLPGLPDNSASSIRHAA